MSYDEEFEKLVNAHVVDVAKLTAKQAEQYSKLWQQQFSFSEREWLNRIDALDKIFKDEQKALAEAHDKALLALDKKYEKPKQQETKKNEKLADEQETESWKETVLKFKKEREEHMRDNFREILDMLDRVDPHEIKIKGVPEYIGEQYAINNNSMDLMAIRHYRALLNHPDNPIFKSVVKEQQEHKKSEEYKQQKAAEEKLRQQEEEEKIRQRLERFKKMRSQYNENNQDMQQSY